MTDQELFKLALEALKLLTGAWQTFGALDYGDNAIAALKERLAQPEQLPVAWVCYGAPGKRDIDFEQADINGLPIGTNLYTHPPQRTEQNFCSRCGKRTKDLITIHTCTPPKD
jgi:hypothetical protein